jgi:hypothetical protein
MTPDAGRPRKSGAGQVQTATIGRSHGNTTDRQLATAEAIVFLEAGVRDLTQALFWGDEAEVREVAVHMVRMAGRALRFMEIAQAAA